MASTSESGHPRNVANFEKLVSSCAGYGDSYNPANSSLSLDALNTLKENSQNGLKAVNATVPELKNALAERKIVFNTMKNIATRVINALRASGADSQLIENAKSIVRKIQGHRASAKLTEDEIKALAAEGKEPKQISSSQFSYDNRLDNFDKLVQMVGSISQYVPNETDLNTEGLKALLADLKSKNTAVVTTNTSLNNNRILRNDVLYKQDTGLVDIALAVKSYVKSVFGASDPRYKQISKLKFIRIKK